MNCARSSAAPLCLLNYLSPGLPAALFEGVAAYLETCLGFPIHVRHETRVSGPPPGARDPFSSGETDAAFMCAPPFFWLEARGAPVELLGAAPVFEDPRAAGRAVYFSEVIVRQESLAASLGDLRGGVWAYNDRCSLSGFYCLLERLAALGEDARFLGRLEASGSHWASTEWVLSGRATAAAIDSNVWRFCVRVAPELGERLRVLETWGPFPIQPLVVHRGLDAGLKAALREVLLGLEGALPPELRDLGLTGFAPVTPADYAGEARALERLLERPSIGV